jgi:hypothetical protein
MIRLFVIGFLGAVICMTVAFIVGIAIAMLFPVEEPAYFGIGFDSRNLPGTILGVLAWIGFALIMSRRFPARK